MRTLLRLATVDALRGLYNRRWLAVLPVFVAVGWLSADNAGFNYAAQQPRQANLWDAPLTMLTNTTVIVFPLVLGFTIVAGDLYLHQRASGGAALTLTRTTSRPAWWAAKVLALAPLAIGYCLLASLGALIGGAVKLPLSMRWSPAAQLSPGNPGASIYPANTAIPPPLFLLLITLYTALALWAVGTVIVFASTLYPRLATPLVVGILWAIAGTGLGVPLYARHGLFALDPEYQISYVIHFGRGPGFSPTSWLGSLLIIVVTLGLATAAGAWRIRHTDF